MGPSARGAAGRVSAAMVVLLAAAAATAGGGVWFIRSRPDSIAPPERPRRVVPVLQREGDGSERLAISPDGRLAACLDAEGWFHLYRSDGSLALRRQFRGAFLMDVYDGGRRSVLAGTGRSGWWVRIIDGRGETVWRQTGAGQVRGVAISPDGNSAFAAVEGGRLYVFDLSGSPRWRRIRTDIQPGPIRYSPVADGLLTETADPPGFGMIGLDGRRRWWHRREPGRFWLETAAQGALVLTVFEQPGVRPRSGFELYTAMGRRLCSVSLEGLEPRAAVSADGGRVALSYRRKLTSGDRQVMERRVGMWTARGTRLWEVGGLFFKPVLAGLVEEPPGVVVAEDYSLLSALDAGGRLAWRGPALREPLVYLVHDEAWRLAWARFRDGSLEVWSL